MNLPNDLKSQKTIIELAKSITNLKKIIVPLPIAQKQAMVTPLLVADDIFLRTAYLTPATHDQELTKLLHKHTDLLDLNGNSIKLSLDQFNNELSRFDRIMLVWGLYKVTYENVGVREMKCPDCGQKITITEGIDLDSVLHGDSIQKWDETIPFNQYIFQINVNYEADIGNNKKQKYMYSFDTKIPTIKDSVQVLNKLSADKLRTNLKEQGNILTRADIMIQNIKGMAISIYDEAGENIIDTVPANMFEDIYIVCKESIPTTVCEDFLEQYDKRFGKFEPNLYKDVKCGSCGSDAKYDFDVDFEFFRRTVYGRRQPAEVL